MTSEPKFKRGDYVRKKGEKGQWHGRVCGEYSTSVTPEGYAVESVFEQGSVQIYPDSALETWIPPATVAAVEEECTAAPDGRHCWHFTESRLLVNPPLNKHICCHCGELRNVNGMLKPNSTVVVGPYWFKGLHPPRDWNPPLR